MAESLKILGGNRLSGTVQVSGAKNSALPLLFASLLTAEECVLENVPDLEDISVSLRLLQSLGSGSRFQNNELHIKTPKITGVEAPYSLVKKLRASFWALGPLVARAREARVSLPGGDAIGTRPVDIHLQGLTALGAEITMQRGTVIARAPGGLHGTKFELGFPSVGATHQLMMAATLAKGETILVGAAREPEVAELAALLSKMGAKIDGAGESTIRIHGVSELGGARERILGDRIEAATYLCAAAMSRGEITVRGIHPSAVRATLKVLAEAGCETEEHSDGATVRSNGRLHAVSFATAPFPELATDVQPLLMAAMTTALGMSQIRETIFESRFGHVAEYRRFGAQIEVDARTAVVHGVEKLSAAPVEAMDIRAAAGLVLMGLVAEGQTEIFEIHHLDRGYENLVDKFRTLGANIARIPLIDKREMVLGC